MAVLSGRPGSNRPPEAWKATALPNELLPLDSCGNLEMCECGNAETCHPESHLNIFPVFLIIKELSNYETLMFTFSHLQILTFLRGQGWIRTTELVRGQIYSLLPLATWLLARPEPPARIELATY